MYGKLSPRRKNETAPCRRSWSRSHPRNISCKPGNIAPDGHNENFGERIQRSNRLPVVSL